jgi:hypothetical protein
MQPKYGRKEKDEIGIDLDGREYHVRRFFGWGTSSTFGYAINAPGHGDARSDFAII